MFERVNGVLGCRTCSTNVFDNQIPRSAFEHHFKHLSVEPRSTNRLTEEKKEKKTKKSNTFS
ncbi:hypothetical protein SK128_027265 [Halocaridina rubra]|uniref:Uncharacterized protein n=1 Tax=Halocaridina rubra TaxID=373956 RepID=A0AAN9ABU3_HALRR